MLALIVVRFLGLFISGLERLLNYFFLLIRNDWVEQQVIPFLVVFIFLSPKSFLLPKLVLEYILCHAAGDKCLKAFGRTLVLGASKLWYTALNTAKIVSLH